ncbi:putative endo-1,3(4)-beta-glucanase, partial [Lachnellula suecica]
ALAVTAVPHRHYRRQDHCTSTVVTEIVTITSSPTITFSVSQISDTGLVNTALPTTETLRASQLSSAGLGSSFLPSTEILSTFQISNSGQSSSSLPTTETISASQSLNTGPGYSPLPTTPTLPTSQVPDTRLSSSFLPTTEALPTSQISNTNTEMSDSDCPETETLPATQTSTELVKSPLPTTEGLPSSQTSDSGPVMQSSNGIPILPGPPKESTMPEGQLTLSSTEHPGLISSTTSETRRTGGIETTLASLSLSEGTSTTTESLPASQTSDSRPVIQTSDSVPILPGPPIESTMPAGQSSSTSTSATTQGPTGRAVGTETTFASLSLTEKVSTSGSTSTVTASVSVITTSVSNGTAQSLPPLSSSQTPETVGTVITSLNITGQPTSGPIISTSISAPTTTIIANQTSLTISTTVSAGPTAANIFLPVATDDPSPILGQRSDHPVPRLGIESHGPIGTNKFYANFFLGSQTAGTWTHPYSVAWSRGGGAAGSWGMVIQALSTSQKVFGPNANVNPVQYFINPIGIQPIVLSALELGPSTTITNTDLTAFSANINLLANAGEKPIITFPLVQGMGFVTGIFNGGTPLLQSGVFFRSITKASTSPKSGVTKFTILLEDGNTWLVYASQPNAPNAAGAPPELDLTVVNNTLIQATSSFNGIIQIAKSPSSDAEALYDAAAGAYATTAIVSGSSNGNTGSYTLSFTNGGLPNTPLLMFCLNHHLESFSFDTNSGVKANVQLDTTTKGKATAVVGNSWTMNENLPTSMGFAPWSPTNVNPGSLSSEAFAALHSIALTERKGKPNFHSFEPLAESNVYQALAKFAQIIYVLNDVLNDTATAQAGLGNLKNAFNLFATNKQDYPLVYDTAWGGAVSSASYTTGNSGADFGNSYYNDHHFHYGYFVYAAAIIGYLDPTWLPANAPWVNALIRDYANPSEVDSFFPVSRAFDWYHGHSWAHGLYETFDGKDEESSSEDSMSAYAIKMWGRTIGDSNMEARGNLQLAITARSLQNYFLYESTNKVEPANFIGNKVSGILFENKIDHTTYFGANPEFVQGIHMLPLLPSSALTRSRTFVQEEWDVYFSNGRAEAVQGGWKGVLFANQALVDASASWNFFTAANWDASWLDGGASRTWYLAMAAGLGGAP